MIPKWIKTLREATNKPFDIEPPLPKYTLTRFAHTDFGVFGRLGEFYTLENQWKNNKRTVSCIPSGEYLCQRGYFHKGGYATFKIMDVPNRDSILFHIGNTDKDTLGCPLIGSSLTAFEWKIGISNSTVAFYKWFDSLEGIDEFQLVIEDVDGVSKL